MIRLSVPLLVAVLAACAERPEPTPDGSVSDAPTVYCPDRPDGWCASYGDACPVEESFCEYGAGLCVGGSCVRQCTAVGYPHCAPDLEEVWRTVNGAASCVCIPR